ncbi:hypothetical protein PIROE2DRAFT_18261, partial [Piromyces sp. E2]
MQYKLNQVDSESFPLLYFNNEVKKTFADDNQLPKKIVSACNNLQIHIEPTEHLDYTRVKENFNLNNIPEKISEKLKNNADTIHTLKSSIDQWRQKHPFSSYPTSTDLEIVTLGTGSALPSKYRNVSSTIILSKRNGHVLLDAGEGTLGQICRHFGLEKTMKEILPKIRMIFISHIHADHHLGMMNILSSVIHEFLSSDEKYVDENLTIIPVPIYSSKTSDETNASSPTAQSQSPLDIDNIIDNNSNFKRRIPVVDNQHNPYRLNRKILRAMFSGKEVGTLKTSNIYKQDQIIPYTSEIDPASSKKEENSEDYDDFSIDDYRNVRIKQPLPGKFNPKKAKELGVPAGKQFGLLAKGECVTTPNGTVVRPEQVKEPDKISSIFIVVDCPSLDHISSLVSQDRLKDESLKHHTQNIIHILGDPEILRNDQYKAWMNGFSDDCN